MYQGVQIYMYISAITIQCAYTFISMVRGKQINKQKCLWVEMNGGRTTRGSGCMGCGDEHFCKTHLYMHTGRLQNICAYIVQAPYHMHETRRCNNHQGIHVRLWE